MKSGNCSTLLVLISLIVTSCSDEKLAYVDTDRLLNSYQAMLDARRQYQRQQQEWQHNLGTLEQEARAATDTAQRLSATLPPAARATQAARAQLRQQQYLSYRQAIEQQDPQEMQRLTQPVLLHVNKYLRQYGEQHGYALIFATGEAGTLVYGQPGLDITTDVAAGLNQALQDSLSRK